jgi:hypothetical protein
VSASKHKRFRFLVTMPIHVSVMIRSSYSSFDADVAAQARLCNNQKLSVGLRRDFDLGGSLSDTSGLEAATAESNGRLTTSLGTETCMGPVSSTPLTTI